MSHGQKVSPMNDQTAGTPSPYVSELFADVEQAIRRALGLKPNVSIRHLPSQRERERIVDFKVALPNGVELELRLAAPGNIPRAWQEGSRLWLTYRYPPDAVDPLDDPLKGPCLEAIGRLFRAHQRLNGAQAARGLVAALRARS